MQKALAILAAAGILATTARGADVTIGWDYPYPTNYVAGFSAHYGPASRQYDGQQEAPGAATREIVVTGLDPTRTYWFALTAYNQYTNRSHYSAELVWDNVAPVLTAPEEIRVRLAAGAPMTLPDYRTLITVTDDVAPNMQMTITQDPAPGAPLVPGMTVSWYAVDDGGNTGRVERVIGVEVIATERPVGLSGVDNRGRVLQVRGE